MADWKKLNKEFDEAIEKISDKQWDDWYNKQKIMGTKQEIEKFIKGLNISPNYHVFNFKENESQYYLEDVIRKALDHFKDNWVISDSEIEEMVMNKFPLKQGGYNSEKSIDMMKRKAYNDGLKDMRSKQTEPKDNWVKVEDFYKKYNSIEDRIIYYRDENTEYCEIELLKLINEAIKS